MTNTPARNLNGWKPERVDHRDRLLSLAPATQLPRMVDLSPRCPPVEDQGPIGSCTAHAGTSAMEFVGGLGPEREAFLNLSRLFLYAETRLLEGTPLDNDAGATIRGTVKALAKHGCPPEALWPYLTTKFSVLPPRSVAEAATQHRALEYFACPSINEVKASLAAGFPVLYGFSVPEHMMSERVTVTGRIDVPGPKEPIVGGHAVLAVGYNDDTGELKFMNSWGAGWGSHGFGYMPFEYFYVTETGALADDAWTIRAAGAPPAPKPLPADVRLAAAEALIGMLNPTDPADKVMRGALVAYAASRAPR